jgi:hypothetical protein
VSAIKVGDLVMVVRACCKQQQGKLGRIFTAEPTPNAQKNSWCCDLFTGPCYFSGWGQWYLKRIPPLDELERDQIVDELTA